MNDLYEPAQEGTIYVCGACGKTSPTRSGFNSSGKRIAQGMWDESCMLNSVLCYSPKPVNGPWRAVPDEDHEE